MATEDDFVTGEGYEYDPFDPIDGENARGSLLRREAQGTAALRAAMEARQNAYRRLFANGGDDADTVMRDIIQFCRGEDTTFHENDRVHALLTGRQEVYRRFMDHLRLSHEAFFEKYTRKPQ